MNINTLTKEQLRKYLSGTCEHYHKYTEHPNCFKKDILKEERVGFLDIEASNLDANFGIILSYCIKDANSKKIWYDVLDKSKDSKFDFGQTDKRVVENLVKDMRRFDRLVAHYGIKFDFPFIRTRAIVCDVDFPKYGEVYVDDTWRWAKNKLKLNSNRLDTMLTTICGSTNKTRVEGKYWIGAMRFDKKSLGYILDHNKRDVIDLEKGYNKLFEYVKQTKSSI